MATIPWGAIVFVVGLGYGYFKKGSTSKLRLLWRGFVLGLVLGIAFALIGNAFDLAPLGLGTGFMGVLANIMGLTLLLILGTFLGDLLER